MLNQLFSKQPTIKSSRHQQQQLEQQQQLQSYNVSSNPVLASSKPQRCVIMMHGKKYVRHPQHKDLMMELLATTVSTNNTCTNNSTNTPSPTTCTTEKTTSSTSISVMTPTTPKHLLLSLLPPLLPAALPNVGPREQTSPATATPSEKANITDASLIMHFAAATKSACTHSICCQCGKENHCLKTSPYWKNDRRVCSDCHNLGYTMQLQQQKTWNGHIREMESESVSTTTSSSSSSSAVLISHKEVAMEANFLAYFYSYFKRSAMNCLLNGAAMSQQVKKLMVGYMYLVKKGTIKLKAHVVHLLKTVEDIIRTHKSKLDYRVAFHQTIEKLEHIERRCSKTCDSCPEKNFAADAVKVSKKRKRSSCSNSSSTCTTSYQLSAAIDCGNM